MASFVLLNKTIKGTSAGPAANGHCTTSIDMGKLSYPSEL